MLWRFVTYVLVVCLLGTDPRFDFFTLHAQCTTPWNPSTPTTRVTQFSYDFDGRLTQMNAPEGVINYTYDLPTGRLTSTCTANSQIAYAYDQLGRLSTVTVLERNGVPLATNEVTAYTYDKVGNRSTVTLRNGVVTTYLYDSLNRLTKLTHQAGTTNLATYSYKLDRTGRRTNAVEILLQEGGAGYLTNTYTWNLDCMYRLTNEMSACSLAAGQYSTAYQYDKVGNRLKRIELIGGTNYTTASSFDTNDELLVETRIQNGVTNGATGYAYDLNGSLTGKTNASGSISYTYNLANKLSSVAESGVTTAFCYNDQGIRVSSSTSSSTNYFLVDANNRTGYQQVLEELPSPGSTPSMSYVIGDNVLAQCGTTGSCPAYFLPDGHDSNRQLINSVSGLASHYNYDAYGVTWIGTSSVVGTNTHLYCGEQFDSTLNMYNLRARYYDPNSGRLSQRDALAGDPSDPDGLHRYVYAQLDPINGKDPSGNQDVIELLTVAAIVVTVATIGLQVYNAVQRVEALGELIEVNRLLADLDLEPEFLIEFSQFSYLLALGLIADLAKISLSIVKEIIGSYSAAIGAMFFLADTFGGNEDGSDTDAAIAQDATEYNSANSIADIRRGLQFERRILGVRAVKTGIFINGNWRIPDNINNQLHVLKEVKSVRELSYTRQLRDYFAYCRRNNLRMKVIYDRSVIRNVSSTLRGMQRANLIDLIAR